MTKNSFIHPKLMRLVSLDDNALRRTTPLTHSRQRYERGRNPRRNISTRSWQRRVGAWWKAVASGEYGDCAGRIEGPAERARQGLTAELHLIYRNTKLAVVEGDGISCRPGRRANSDFAAGSRCASTFSTNGRAVYGIDMDTGQGR